VFSQAPTVMTRKSVKPVVVASSNGNQYKNGGAQTGVEKAFSMIAGGSDVLDALIAGVNIVELDPLDDSVGYGGLPNANGVVQLDSCCMHGPAKRAGGVAGIEGVRTPSRVAQLVMDTTDHHLLVGKGAQDFARDMGFTIEDDLNTENSRGKWLEWKRRTDPLHYLSPKERQRAYHDVAMQMIAEGIIDRDHYYGTINCDGISPKGEICGVTTTSGLSWKIPGRVGDSPILGAGLYVDGEVGAAGSTGRGEANLYNLSSFMVVEEMRRGAHPKDACPDDASPHREEHDREAAAQFEGAAELRAQLLLPEREGRARRRVDVRVDLRRVHRERRADGQDRRAVRGKRSGLTADYPIFL
jgi:N4-(beta-N-acetylglucosaminyl)-L-asparaginase